jgi:hypothetical protein
VGRDERFTASAKQEREGMKRYGGKQHGGSGSGWSKRHDGHTTSHEDRALTSGTLFEFKTVLGGKRQITVKADDLLSVERTAILEGRLPVLQIEVGKRQYVVLTQEDFEEKWIIDERTAADERPGDS